MMRFLQKNFNNLGDVYIRGPLDRDLSYDHGPCRIGFDGITISNYMIGMCCWIALKVGKKKMFPTKANPMVSGPHKYIVYDGRETWPLHITQRYQKKYSYLVQIDWVGALVPKPRLFYELFQPHPATVIHEELKRLDGLWNKENT